uniref:ABC transporter TMD0 domain-containing protein n=1 Tax=Timema monikensis TaxID=170555 RepID=A0A7R9E7A0_9NEOP|nr:unnamed protein product [Timema monikensis]
MSSILFFVELIQLYNNNTEFCLKARMISALAFVPENDLDQALDLLAEELPDNLQPLIDWFEDNYIGRRNRRGVGRRVALFPPNMWFLYTRVLNGTDRTNNHTEAAHLRLGTELGMQHPTKWKFIDALRKWSVMHPEIMLEDTNLTWNTTDPDLTPCFQKTVLVWIPCSFLWLFSSLETYYILHSKTKNVPWNWLNISKIILTAILIVLSIADVGLVASRRSNEFEVFSVDYYTPIIRMVTFALTIALIVYNRKRGLRTSGLLFLFWFILTIFGIPQFRFEIRRALRDDPRPEPFFPFVSYMIYYPVTVAIFILNCFADAPPKYSEYPPVENPCPEQGASFLSKLFFSWFDALAWKGFRKPLETSDLWNMNPEDTSSEIVPIFDKYWEKSKRKSEKVSSPKATFRKTSGRIDFVSGKQKTKQQASVLPAICKAFGPTFLFGSALKLFNDILTFVSPQILRRDSSKGFLPKGNSNFLWVVSPPVAI